MTLTELFIADVERERARTRKVIEAVPEGQSEWKPQDKAMPLGRLTNLVASMASWISMMVAHDEFDVVPKPGQQSQFSHQFTTRAELTKAVDNGFDGARAALASSSDEHLLEPWRLKAGGRVVQEAPRHVMLRDALMHLAHHRGQLTTYLRVHGEKVPAVYGPSADDQSF